MCATTAHALSGASLAHHDPPRAHARPPRGTCDERVARAASRQHRGSAAAACTDKQSVSAPTWKHADCGQLSTEWRREVVSRGSRHAGRGAERGGEGRRLTCTCRALRFAVGGVVEGRSRRRGASGVAPRFLGRCYGHAPRHPALPGVGGGGRRRGRDRRADRRRQGGWERCRLRSPTAGAGRGRALEGTELWPFDVELGSAGSAGELYIAVPAGRTA